MPRTWPRYDKLTRILKQSLGSQGAKQELQWMKQSLKGRAVDFNEANLRRNLDDQLLHMVKLRAQGTPLAYVIGDQPFGPLSVKTRAPTLIPRPETEDWTMRVSQLISPTKENPVTILDLCTGTGCIPLLLTHLWPVNSARALAIDVSRDAVLLAQENAHNHRLSYYGDVDPLQEGNYIRIIQQDIFSPTFRSFLLEKRIEAKPFDILTCNPPYIPRKEHERLSPSVREFEDRRALLGEEDGDGLTFYRKLANIIAEDRDSDDRIFARGALVALEHGEGQSSSIRTIMETRTRGLVKRSEAWLDQWGKERTVVLRLNEK